MFEPLSKAGPLQVIWLTWHMTGLVRWRL